MIEFVKKAEDWRKINNVIVSVSDKTGLKEFVSELLKINPDITFFSTGGTFKVVKEIAKNAIEIADYTKFPEMPGGLVKSLHPKIHAGILGETYNEGHKEYMEKHGIQYMDMVVVNLYPFKQVIEEKGTPEMARSNIDIGGPTMTDAAAKNFLRVAVVVEPNDYDEIIKMLKANDGKLSLGMRHKLAQRAFSHLADYLAAIKKYFEKTSADDFKKCYEIGDLNG